MSKRYFHPSPAARMAGMQPEEYDPAEEAPEFDPCEDCGEPEHPGHECEVPEAPGRVADDRRGQ